MSRNEINELIFKKYAVRPEHPWSKYPEYTVFRHESNRKWFCVLMRIPISKLGILERREVNIINLKCPAQYLDEVWMHDGIFPAYHMNKEHWISVLLDGSVDNDTIAELIEISYKATAPKIL